MKPETNKKERTYMGNYEKGKADAAAGKSTPPHSGILDNIASGLSERAAERQDKAKAEWREGYYDKKREMELEKKKH